MKAGKMMALGKGALMELITAAEGLKKTDSLHMVEWCKTPAEDGIDLRQGSEARSQGENCRSMRFSRPSLSRDSCGSYVFDEDSGAPWGTVERWHSRGNI